MIKTVILDFDGTIAESLDFVIQTVIKRSGKYSYLKLDPGQVKTLVRGGSGKLIQFLKLEGSQISRLLDDIRDDLGANLLKIKTYENVPNTLLKLHQKGLKLGILTTNTKSNVENFLSKQKINYFDFIYSESGLFDKGKLISKALKENGLKTNETVYVGDEDRDILAAKEAGIKSVAVTWGLNSKLHLKSYKPDFVISKPKELLSIIN